MPNWYVFLSSTRLSWRGSKRGVLLVGDFADAHPERTASTRTRAKGRSSLSPLALPMIELAGRNERHLQVDAVAQIDRLAGDRTGGRLPPPGFGRVERPTGHVTTAAAGSDAGAGMTGTTGTGTPGGTASGSSSTWA